LASLRCDGSEEQFCRYLLPTNLKLFLELYSTSFIAGEALLINSEIIKRPTNLERMICV